MENDLLEGEEDSVYTKEICGKKCLHYKLHYKDEKMIKDKRFIKWLNEEKRNNKNKENYFLKCQNCHFCVYSYKEDYSCCEKKSLICICLFCGEIFHGSSYCCARRGLLEISNQYILYFSYACNFKKGDGFLESFKVMPFIFNLIFIGTIYVGFFCHRKLTVGNSEFSNYEHRTSLLARSALIIFGLFTLIMSFVFFFHFLIIYFIYLIIYTMHYKRKRKINI